LAALSWAVKKKKLVHDMVQTDARNKQMQGNVKVLREDIDVLRDQVARLERRLDFAQGQGTK
jgi:polyhydroxyalkanoate synthesis regulator phasin